MTECESECEGGGGRFEKQSRFFPFGYWADKFRKQQRWTEYALGKCLQCYGSHMILDSPIFWPVFWSAGFGDLKKHHWGKFTMSLCYFHQQELQNTKAFKQAILLRRFSLLWTSSMISVQKLTKDLSFRKLKKYVRLCVCPGWRDAFDMCASDLLIFLTVCIFNLIPPHTRPTFVSLPDIRLCELFFVCHFRRFVSFHISSLTYHCVMETASL